MLNKNWAIMSSGLDGLDKECYIHGCGLDLQTEGVQVALGRDMLFIRRRKKVRALVRRFFEVIEHKSLKSSSV